MTLSLSLSENEGMESRGQGTRRGIFSWRKEETVVEQREVRDE
jgi:hypothetical protein